jgi:hypothetical protein
MTVHAANQRKVSQIIADLSREPKDRVMLADLLAVLDERAFGVLMLILSLPNAVGLGTIPGLSTVFGVPQIFVSMQMIFGMQRPWLPRFVLERSIAMKDFRTMAEKAEPVLVKIERLLRPRLDIVSSKMIERVLGLVLLLLSITVTLPIPFANQPPAIGQALIALGLIERDGVFVIIGVIASAIAIGIAFIVGGGIIAGVYFGAKALIGF